MLAAQLAHLGYSAGMGNHAHFLFHVLLVTHHPGRLVRGNQAALQVHLDAVREVSSIIARSIQEVESDGTYSSTGPRR